MNKRVSAVLALLALACGPAFGSGMLIPKDESLPPLAIKHQRVDIAIKDGVASARIEQVFQNSVDRDLEAVYVFPLPENAGIADFAMWINGKRVSGELVEKDKARRVYEDIVRRLKDPGLLEYLGGNLFRVSVYPVPKRGEQRIELEYSQTLAFDAGLYKLVYPLKTGERASRTLEDFTVSARLASSVPIKSVYSPSHQVGISRKGDREAVIGFEEERSLLDRDFVLYYSVSKKDFGLSLLAHAAKGQDGFCMMLLAPSVTPPDEAVLRKDVTLVCDTSGSMAGKKIEQARGALEHCVNRLNDGDRFNIIRFSTEIEVFSEKLVAVSAGTRKKALEFVKGIEARGGTAIDAALAKALDMDYAADRPHVVAFLTDGKPTIGETETDTIVGNVKKANRGNARLFVFGVGDEVNTHLLDRLSGENGGLSRYVTPDEDIEEKLSAFADKLTHPVLANVQVKVDKLALTKMYPAALPDLFSGDQLTIFGRYAGEGHVAIRLTGEANGKPREFVYEGTFPAATAENVFIPRLWATRRVGHLLDEIRLHGEDRELKDEVIRLSQEYGIMTPYTSYLVLEDDKAYRQHGIERDGERESVRPSEVFARRAQGGAGRDRMLARKPASDRGAPAATAAESPAAPTPAMVPVFGESVADATALGAAAGRGGRYRVLREEARAINGYIRQDTGAGAVEVSKAIQSYKARDSAAEDLRTVRHAGGKVFFLIGERWVDSAYREDLKSARVKFGSKEYFDLLARRPELKPWLTLGAKVSVALDDGTALIVEE